MPYIHDMYDYKKDFAVSCKECFLNAIFTILGCLHAVFRAVSSCFCSFCRYVEPDNPIEPGSEILPTWRLLWVEFVNRTTWHGLKYLELRSRYLVRKMIWSTVMLSNIILFMYIMTTKLQTLLQYQTTVSVNVLYNDTLPYPAVTICNHNPYRLTVMHEKGLYDIMVNDMDDLQLCPECGEYLFYPGICQIKRSESSGSLYLKVNEVTRKVCMSLCSLTYDDTCSGFLYDRYKRSCVLSSYTGEWVDPYDSPCTPKIRNEFYRRKRKINLTEIVCSFEDLLCPLQNQLGEKDAFVLTEAQNDAVKKDNTLNLGSGHVMSLRSTVLKLGYTAQMTLPYLNTSNSCLELFYWLQVYDLDTGELPFLTVSVLTEERQKIVLKKTERYLNDWNRFYVKLPEGINQIMIEGTRATSNNSGIAIDDITVKECQNFDYTRSCKRTRRGIAYMGTMSVTAKGETCMAWDQVRNPLIYRLPDESPTDARNYCRNIPQENWSEPGCLVSSNDKFYVSQCNIPYCECYDETYFKCDRGLCLPPNLLCNGVKDCLDGSDEAENCSDRQKVECLFDNDYICGYTSDSIGQLGWKRVPSTELSSYTDVTIYGNVSALSHLMFLDSKLGQNGDQVQLVSPRWSFPTWTTVRFMYILVGSNSPSPTQEVTSFYLYQYSPLRYPVQLLKKIQPQQQMKDFQMESVCVPPGSYHLMFLGMQGIPYEQVIGLPYVEVGGTCVPENKTEVSVNSGRLSADEPTSFNCSFSTLCGYRFISTSYFFSSNLIYTKNALNPQGTFNVCDSIFKGVQGVITSPGYPNNYFNNLECNFEIDEPEGTTITITFEEFTVESQSDCLFDRLEITDPYSNITKVYCGNVRPPIFMSKGNKLRLSFKSDSSFNNGRFKLYYVTYANNETDYAIAFKYSNLSNFHGYTHKATLTSPAMTVTSEKCLVVTLIAVTPFKITIAYLNDSSKYTEKTLLSSSTSLGWAWHKQWLDLTILNTEFVIKYEINVDSPSITEPALIGDIRNLDGNCRTNAKKISLQCSFGDIDQCGYMDASEESNYWFRVYDPNTNGYFMTSNFNEGLSKRTTILRSADIPSAETEQCLQVNYFANSPYFIMTINSDNKLDHEAISINLLTDGEFKFFYPLKPVEGSRSIRISATFIPSISERDNFSGREVRLRSINVIDGPCTSTDGKTAQLDCSFDSFAACNYKLSSSFGESWTWKLSKNLESQMNNDHNGVVYFAPMKQTGVQGVMTTPLISSTTSSMVTFEAYTTSMETSSLSVFAGNSLGLITGTSSLLQASWKSSRTWQEFKLCIPVGDWHLFFVADVKNSSTSFQYIAVDNVVWISTNSSKCDPKPDSLAVSNCNEKDLSDCPSTLHSWSTAMRWVKTNNIPSSFSQGKEGCIYVFDQSEGWFSFKETGKQFENRTECDIYIRGNGDISVQLWLEEFEIQNCSSHFVEVWWRNSGGSENKSTVVCERTNNTSPLTFVTNRVLQIHISYYNGYPKLKLSYKYTSNLTRGYLPGLYYDGITPYTANLTDDSELVVAAWTSPEFNFNISKSSQPLPLKVCLKVDFLLPQLDMVINAYHQSVPDVIQIPVYSTSSYTSSQRTWTNATFEIVFDEISYSLNPKNLDFSVHKFQFQFLFMLSLDKELNQSGTYGGQLLAAFDNVQIEPGDCIQESKIPSKSLCRSETPKTCHFVDISTGRSRWTTSSYLASSVNNNKDCQLDGNGYVYEGNVSTTIFGRTCQSWSSQTPHKHNQDVADYFPDTSMSSTGNKCRNPMNPFIPRNCWCYTMDVKQRREYCDIPLCVESFYEVEMDSFSLAPAILFTELNISQSSCLSFSYSIPNLLVNLEVYTKTKLNGNETLKALLKRQQQSGQVTKWLSKNITLTSADKYFYFYARKTDYTQKNPLLFLGNITISRGNCNGNVDTQTTDSYRIPYTGPKLPRSGYKEVLLDEISNTTMLELNGEMAHEKIRLIHSCRYDGADCAEDDMSTLMTDMGQCYSFNMNGGNKYASTTGAFSGVRFVLNVEQYEHVAGYVSGVGIKIHLHDTSEIPSMLALGLAAQPSVHNLGILGYTTIQNLNPPFGRCGEIPLNLSLPSLYSSSYTETKCRLEKQTLELQNLCGCREPYMPGSSDLCNLTSYLNCSRESSVANLTMSSECPSACEINSFSVQLTQSRLSGLRINELLGNSSDQVEASYLKAIEMNKRITGAAFNTVLKFLEKLNTDLQRLRNFIYYSLLQFETSSIKHIEVAIQTFMEFTTAEIRDQGLQLLAASDQKYFQQYQPKLAYLLTSMRSAYSALAFYMDLQAEAARNLDNSLSKLKWYRQVTNDTLFKLVVLNETFSIYSLEHSLISQFSVNCTLAAAERNIVNMSGSSVDCKCKFKILDFKTKELLVDFNNVVVLLERQLPDGSDNAWIKQIDIEKISDVLKLLRETTDCKSKYESVSFDVKTWLKSDSLIPELKNYTTELVSQDMLIAFNEMEAWLADLKTNYLISQISLKTLAENITGSRLDYQTRKINTIINDINQRVVVPLQDGIVTTQQFIIALYQNFLKQLILLKNVSEHFDFEQQAKTLNIWRKPYVNLEMPETIIFINSKNDTWQVWPAQESLISFYGSRSNSRLEVIVNNYFQQLQDYTVNFFKELTERHENVKRDAETLSSALKKYLDSTTVDADFIMSNFLVLDIYYGEMKYDSVSASQSYGWINFFSDLGSYFGLLMGCSILTMFEVIDLVVYHAIVKIVEVFEQRKKKRRHVININITPSESSTPERKSGSILNRAFSPEEVARQSSVSNGNSIRESYPSTVSSTKMNGNSWNIQL